MKILNTTMKALLAGALAMALPTAANAVPTLRIDVNNDGTIEFEIADASLNDSSALSNVVRFIAPSVTVDSTTTGSTRLGTFTNPVLSLSNITIDGPAGVYGIYFSEVGFGPTQAGFSADLTLNPAAGTAVVAYDTFSSSTNALFALTDPITTQLNATPTATAGAAFGLAPNYVTSGAPYSLTQRVVVTITGTGSFTVAADLRTVPDGGATLALLGLALVGMEGVRRRFSGIAGLKA